MKLLVTSKLLLFLVIISSEKTFSVSGTLRNFIECASHCSIATVYLVGLEHRTVLGPLLSLSNVPRVIIDAEQTIGVLDESCLVVFYLDMQNEVNANTRKINK